MDQEHMKNMGQNIQREPRELSSDTRLLASGGD